MHLSLTPHPELRVCQEPLDGELKGVDGTCRDIIREYFGITFNGSGQMPTQHRKAISDALYLEKVFEKFDLVKFLYFQIFPYPNLTAYLRAKTDLKIIHLRRRDIFSRYISEAVAARSGKWHIHNEKERKLLDLTPLRLDPAHVAQSFGAEMHFCKLVNSFFPSHLEVFYENLVENWEQETEKIQNFLEITPIKLDMKVKKSIQTDSRSLVLNMEELSTHPLLAPHAEIVLYGKSKSSLKVL